MVKWAFLTGLENCGKMGVFDRIGPDYGGRCSRE